MASIRFTLTNGDEIEIGVSSVPNRKSQFLYTTRGAMVEPLAYFRNDECAARFSRILDRIVDSFQKGNIC